MIDNHKIGKFAAVNSEAVLTYPDSVEAQWPLWACVPNPLDPGASGGNPISSPEQRKRSNSSG